MFNPRKLFVLLTAIVFLATACAPTAQPPSTGAQTATALVAAAEEELMVQNAAASATAMLGGSPSVPVFTQTPMPPTPQGIAPAASATPQPADGYQLSSFCYSAEKLGISFPVNREMAYQMFVGKSAGDTVTRSDDMTPLLTDGTNLLYGWTYSRHGGSSEPVVTVTNPTLFMQNGWIHDSDLRSLYGYTLQEAGILDTGRNVTGAGIPGLAQNVRVEGFTFFCAPPSADKGAVLPGHHLVNERSTAYLIQQLPLP